jgi:hypothetical protein
MAALLAVDGGIAVGVGRTTQGALRNSLLELMVLLCRGWRLREQAHGGMGHEASSWFPNPLQTSRRGRKLLMAVGAKSGATIKPHR